MEESFFDKHDQEFSFAIERARSCHLGDEAAFVEVLNRALELKIRAPDSFRRMRDEIPQFIRVRLSQDQEVKNILPKWANGDVDELLKRLGIHIEDYGVGMFQRWMADPQSTLEKQPKKIIVLEANKNQDLHFVTGNNPVVSLGYDSDDWVIAFPISKSRIIVAFENEEMKNIFVEMPALFQWYVISKSFIKHSRECVIYHDGSLMARIAEAEEVMNIQVN